MESFQISLQLGCLSSTTPNAFAKGRIRQGKHCLRPDCECKGTAKYSHTQENNIKKYENLFLYKWFWGIQVTKNKKTGYFAIFSHGLSRVTTEDTENFIITRTITDDHGGLYHHTDKRGCTRTMRRIIFSHGRLRMARRTFESSHGCARNVTEEIEDYGANSVSLEYLWISVTIRVKTI